MAEQYSKLEWDEASGKWAPPTNRPGAPTLVWDGFNWQYGEDNPEGPGALSRGLATGMEGIKGAVVDLLPAMAQSTLGFDDAARRNLEEYAARFKELEKTGYLARTQFGDIKDVDSFLSWFGETLGQAAPSMVPVAGGAGAGAVVGGRLLAGAATKIPGPVATALTRNTLKETTEALVARGIARNEAAGIAAKNLAQMAGAAGGAFAGGWIQNAPESFKEIFDETGELRPGLAAGLGTIKSALDTVGPVALLSKVKGAQFADQVKSRIAGKLLEGRPGAAGALGGIIGGLAVEGLTEGTQALVDELALAALNDKSIDWDKIFENFAAGAAVGSVVGGVGGAIAGRRQAQAQAAQAQAQAQAQARDQETQDLAERATQLGEVQPVRAAPTDEELKASAIRTVRNLYPTVQIDDQGKISAQDINREAQRQTAQAAQRGEAVPFTQVRSNLLRKIQNDLQVRIGQAQAESRIPQGAPINVATTPARDPLQQLRALAAEDLTGLPLPAQEEILEARRRLQELEGGEAQIQGLTEGFPAQPTPLQLTQATYEVPGQPPLTRDQVYKLVDRAIERGRADLVPLRNLQTSDEPAKIEKLIAGLTQPDIAQVTTPSGEFITEAAERPAAQEDVRSDIAGYVAEAQEALPSIDPEVVGKAARWAYRLPRGERLNQTTLTRALRQEGVNIPVTQIAQISKVLQEGNLPSRQAEALARNEAPAPLFEQGVKVGGVERGVPAAQAPASAPVEDLTKIEEALSTGKDLDEFTSQGLTQYLASRGVDVPPKTSRKKLERMLRGAPSSGEGTQPTAQKGARLNVPPDADPTVVENAQKFQEESQKDSDSKSLLDTPYTCRT